MTDSGTRKILVADDVKVLALSVSGSLAAQGYETAIASDGRECLEMVESFEPDLLILDIMMPKMHGVEVLKRLRSKKLGVIVCTAKDFRTDTSRIRDLGAVEILIKPVDEDVLIAKVGEFFAREASSTGRRAPAPATTKATPTTEYHHELETSSAVCQLWGTRGSIPVSEPQFVRSGGNTSCMAIEYGDHRLVFDAGSGIRALGLSLMSSGPRKIHLFITHTHWDHIQGFPFFAPAYAPGYEITVYGVEGFGKNLQSLFQGQLDPDFFPVQMEDMAARLNFVELGTEPVRIGDAEVTWAYTQHPGATVGYRFQLGDRSVAWVPDNEFLQGYVDSPFDFDRHSSQAIDYESVIRLVTDVSVLFHECQYTHDEYLSRVGWGHSSVPNACLLAKFCQSKRWVVVHHDPMHGDAFLQRKLSMTRQLLERLGHPGHVSHGFDGWCDSI